MPLDARPHEVLHAQAALLELVGERVAEDAQATELLPVDPEAIAEVTVGLGDVDALEFAAELGGLGSSQQC